MRGPAQAVDALRTSLRASFSKYPSDKHFIVAHSHGGNVALRAVCGTELEGNVHGIVCMCTPFLHVVRYGGVDPGRVVANVMG